MVDAPKNPLRFYWSEEYDGDPLLVERHDVERLLRAAEVLIAETQQHDSIPLTIKLAAADLHKLVQITPLRMRSLREILSSRPRPDRHIGDDGDDPRSG